VTTVRRVTAVERREGDPTAGMIREEAFATENLWAGIARADGGSTSAWHHHGDHETALYILAGTFRVEFGPRGGEAIEARSGDFVHIPASLIHRELNPSSEESRFVVVRGGSGPPTINVDGPEEAP